MRVLLSNYCGAEIGYLAARYPGALGHLYSPGQQCGPWKFLPYALDNGAFPAFLRGKPFDVGAWRELLAWARVCGQRPTWALVPDVVGDATATLRAWDAYAAETATLGVPLAFAAQDGHEPSDVPDGAEVVFIGGSTEWKRAAITPWCRVFPRVHVGRINTYRWLRVCEAAGAESVDGTGWKRGGRDSAQWKGLLQWLAEQAGETTRTLQESLSFDGSESDAGPGSSSTAISAPDAAGATSIGRG
jgi:hypothetical protein